MPLCIMGNVKKMKPHLAIKYTCTGCMACVDSCQTFALKGTWSGDGHLYVVCIEEKCIQCGKCVKVCPITSQFSYEKENSTSIPYTAWSNDDAIRMTSSSGGIFATIAYYIIKNGGCVAGSVMDDISIKHILTDKVEDIALMQGSKYQQGNSTGIYINVKEKLKEGRRVFFSGVPCQVAGLYSFLGKLAESELLLTADLVCSGFPSSCLLKRFIEEIGFDENKTQKISVTYRNKNAGWEKSKKITITYNEKNDEPKKNKITDYGFNNLVYSGFGCNYTARYSCGDCQFSFLKRKSDMTLADFWGEKQFPEEHFKGISCVVTHSDAGLKMLAVAGITFHKIQWKNFIPYNKMVYQKIHFLQVHPARKFLAWNFSHFSYATLEKIYGGKIDKKDILWLPYKIFNFVLWKISNHKAKKYNSMILKKLNHEKN